MSASGWTAGTVEAEPSPVAANGLGDGPGADLAGRTFRQLTVIPALLATSWLLAGLPLLLLDRFTPLLMLVVSVPLAAVLVTLGLRWISGGSQGLLAVGGGLATPTPWWTIAALLAVAVAFGVDQLAYHSQQIIVERDPASYIQFGNWIARHGALPIPQDAAAFGGYHHSLSFSSPAFYAVGHAIVPQFMAGLPITLAAAFWIGGVSAAAATGVLLGSCGILAFGGLIGRLVGPRWAPLGALVLALSLPEQFTSRSTYSEPLAQLVFLGGLCLVVDSFTPGGAAKRKIAALGGLVIGLTLVVRIDGASDILPLIPYCGLLVLGRRRQAWPLIAGLAVGAGYGAIDGLVLSRPYLTEIRGSLLPVLLSGFLLLVATGIAVRLRWARGLPELGTGWLPDAAALAAFVVLAGFVIRPYVQTVHGQKPHAQMQAMAALQAAQHLPIQPTRLYYEMSMDWVFWYIGVPAVVLATVGAAVVVRRCLQGRVPAWGLPLMAFAWIIVSTLLRPSIIPLQPWASRRLVPGVLPGLILLAEFAACWLVGQLRQRGAGPVLRASVVAFLAAALILPAVKTTFGLAHRAGGPLGVHVVAVGLADHTTFRGEITAVHDLCAAIPANASALFISAQAGDQLAQVVRGMCGEPAAVVVQPGRQNVQALIEDIRRAGRRPVLLASSSAALVGYGRPVQVMKLTSQTDAHSLVTPPLYTHRFELDIWMSVFSG